MNIVWRLPDWPELVSSTKLINLSNDKMARKTKIEELFSDLIPNNLINKINPANNQSIKGERKDKVKKKKREQYYSLI
uniref:Uncharacterized protein n=1 Tax=Nelumbo nucifera TaxID=4432 RepID=A0A822YYM0_NELNU|nr:TPA_asm: hypothetical protein HUJ06_006466 [Nelumbo nucifera]